MTGPRTADRPATPADDLARRAAGTPTAAALHWRDGRWSYRQLDRRATAFADRLVASDATPAGAAVTLRLTPSPEAIAALFGVWRAGCLAVPLHERLTLAELEHARRTVMSASHIDNETLHGAAAASAAPPPAAARRNPRDPVADHYAAFPDVVALILTSGSSGAAKGVGFTHDTLAASARAVASRLSLTEDDRWGLCLSPGHIGGLSLVVRAVMTGASVRLWPSFDPDAVARAVLGGRVTHLAVVPVMLRRLVSRLARECVPDTLRCVLVGGAAASGTLLEAAWAAGLPVAPTWGMTETASQVATAPPRLARHRPGTVGRPLRGIEVRRTPGGVLSVRGPTLASFVVPRSGAPPQALPTDPDGWFATSDIGRVDPEGLIWIEGRADAIIVSGGTNVNPGEVERVIESLPGVAEAVVFGVPDDEWGEVVAAVVQGGAASVTAADVDRHCRARLSRARCPSRILVVDDLPRTWTGKVMRSRVSERYGPRLNARNKT